MFTKSLTPLSLALWLGIAPAKASDVNELIDQNTATQQQITQQIKQRANATSVRPSDLPDLRFWPHVRANAQKGGLIALLKELQEAGGSASLGREIDTQVIQVLDQGPNFSQLRFFKASDAPTADVLMRWFANKGLELRVVDLTERYKSETWIEVGHFELWLSADALKD